jgi:hypothetical protein
MKGLFARAFEVVGKIGREMGRAYFVGASQEAKRVVSVKFFADPQVTESYHLIEQLKECVPIEEHLDTIGVKELCASLKSGSGEKARRAITEGAKDGATRVCITALTIAVTKICDHAPAILREATYNLIGCK